MVQSCPWHVYFGGDELDEVAAYAVSAFTERAPSLSVNTVERFKANTVANTNNAAILLINITLFFIIIIIKS